MKKSTKQRKATAPGSADILSASRAPAPTIQGELQTDSQPGSPSASSEYSVVDASAPNQELEIPALSTLTESSIHQNKNPAADASENNQSSIINNQSAQSVPPRRGGKPFQPLPEFASLSRDQLDYIHEILRTKT